MENTDQDAVILQMPGLCISRRQVTYKTSTFPLKALKDVRVRESNEPAGSTRGPAMIRAGFIGFGGGFLLYLLLTLEPPNPLVLGLVGLLGVFSIGLIVAGFLVVVITSMIAERYEVVAGTSSGDTTVYRSSKREKAEYVAKILRQVIATGGENMEIEKPPSEKSTVETIAPLPALASDSQPRILRLALLGIVGLFLLLFAYAVWPTPYRYDSISREGFSFPVRINRLTGQAQYLSPGDGWKPVKRD